MSQNSLARKLGVSPSTLINFKNGQWDKISDDMFHSVNSHFQNRDEKWKRVNTWNFEAINRVCDDAQASKRMMAIAGYTGAGKTTALLWYANEFSQVFYVLANTLMNKRTFLGALERSMGLKGGATIHEMVEGIIDKIRSYPNPLIIIDDAGKLSDSILPIIQLIYDATEERAGVVLAGTEYLEKMFRNGLRFNKLGYRELYRRISYWQPLRPPTLKKVEEICNAHQITDKDCIQYIHQNASNYGDIRNYITNARKAHSERKVPINRELLESLAVGNHYYNLAKS